MKYYKLYLAAFIVLISLSCKTEDEELNRPELVNTVKAEINDVSWQPTDLDDNCSKALNGSWQWATISGNTKSMFTIKLYKLKPGGTNAYYGSWNERLTVQIFDILEPGAYWLKDHYEDKLTGGFVEYRILSMNELGRHGVYINIPEESSVSAIITSIEPIEGSSLYEISGQISGRLYKESNTDEYIDLSLGFQFRKPNMHTFDQCALRY